MRDEMARLVTARLARVETENVVLRAQLERVEKLAKRLRDLGNHADFRPCRYDNVIEECADELERALSDPETPCAHLRGRIELVGLPDNETGLTEQVYVCADCGKRMDVGDVPEGAAKR